jgi:hypothetical protein
MSEQARYDFSFYRVAELAVLLRTVKTEDPDNQDMIDAILEEFKERDKENLREAAGDAKL